MLSFTRQEQTVLVTLAVIIVCGAFLQYLVKSYPSLVPIMQVIESDVIYQSVDVNTASIEELDALPYIGMYTAARIVDFRQEHGAFHAVSEIAAIPGIRRDNYERFAKYLLVGRVP